MQFVQQFNYELADGTIIDDPTIMHGMFLSWTSTLTTEEREQFRLDTLQQESYRQQIIDEGKMSIGKNTEYIWKDYKTMKTGKPEDPIWSLYFTRYLSENNMKLIDTLIPVV